MSDLIKREDAMQVAFLYPFFSNALMEEIKAIPSADRPQGEWKKNKTYKRIIFCSECGEPFEQSNSAECWNFCPNCGADMRGE